MCFTLITHTEKKKRLTLEKEFFFIRCKLKKNKKMNNFNDKKINSMFSEGVSSVAELVSAWYL